MLYGLQAPPLRETGARFVTFFYNCFWWTHFRQLVIATSQIGYIWEQFQMLYTWFQLYLNYFNTAVDDVLMSHLTEPTPYMRQVLSPAAYMGR